MITPKVHILNRNQIDDSKWNQTIRNAANSLPYAYTWYMDALCTKWVGFVTGDYEFVMPVAVGRKWGVLYVFQPLFCQQLGVFYRRKSEVIIDVMLKTMLKKFIYINYNINADNATKTQIRGLGNKKNLTINLSGKHSEVQKAYSENTTRNIKKALKAELVFEQAEKKLSEAFVDFYVANTAIKDLNFKQRHVESLKKLVHQFMINDCGKLFVAKNANDETCAGVIVVETPSRIIHLLPATNDNARQTGAMHFLVDAILKHYECTDKLYDFEGSTVDSIARFYESFGATKELFFVLDKSPFKATKLGKGV